MSTPYSLKKWLTVNNLFLLAALVLAVVALVYAIRNKSEIDEDDESKKSKFTNKMSDDYSGYSGAPDDLAYQRTLHGIDFWSSMNGNSTNNIKVLDGHDASNALTSGSAQSQCPPQAVAEAYNPHLSSSSSSPKMLNTAAAYASSYADETAANSLAGKVTYSCAPDVAAAGGCDYALNPDNLMPGSWRAGVGCSDGTDPNSQWAKYHPTRDKYYRYITAAASARLGVITRAPNSKILGIPLLIRSGTSTPISSTDILFNNSSLRAQAIFDSVGSYPQDHSSC
jgi:hypothetical protein